MRTIAPLIAVLCFLPRFLVASDQDLRAQLTASYAHKGLLLRHPVPQNSQHYDSSGKLLSGGDEGSWTVYAPVEVARIDFTSDKLRIVAKRLFYVYDPKLREFLAHRQKHPAKIKIEIALVAPLSTLGEASALMNRVFASNPEELASSLPDYWRTCFQTQQEKTLPGTSTPSGTESNTDKSGNAEKPLRLARIGMKGVNPPQPIFTPDPNFAEFARQERIQGRCVLRVVVGVDGKVHQIYILRPLGGGLDEEAVSTVRTWNFKPATQDGQPVPFEMSVEVGFYLY